MKRLRVEIELSEDKEYSFSEIAEEIKKTKENWTSIAIINEGEKGVEAAAPGLLSAAQEALEALFNLAPRFREAGCFTPNHEEDICPCTACKLKAAIAKAVSE